jgi:hypothetical protein
VGPRAGTPAPWRRVKQHSPRRSGDGIELPAPESGDPPCVNTTGRLRHKEAKLLMSCSQPMDCGSDEPTPAEEDAKTERTVLMRVLALHPTHLTMPELAAEVLEDPDDFAEGDALARAVRDLGAAGLVRINGVVVMPTRAALHFYRLKP